MNVSEKSQAMPALIKGSLLAVPSAILIVGLFAGLFAAIGCQSDAPHQPIASFETVSATSLDGQPFDVSTSSHVATVLIFLLPDCPIANGYAPEITRLHQAYKDQGIRFVLVYSDRDITQEKVTAHRADYRHTSEAVIDTKLSLAKLTGATITPEAVVLSPKGAVLYRGRIDDRFPAYGKRREKPTTTELRDALDAMLAGKPIVVARSQAVGCFLDVK